MGHSEVVSREPYLTVTPEMFDEATGKGAAKCDAHCAAVGSRTESQGVAIRQCDKVVSHANEPIKQGVPGPHDTGNATGPRGIRTLDRAIMSRLL